MRVAAENLVWDTVDSSSATYTSTSGDTSNTALYSGPIALRHLSGYAIQLNIASGTPTGTFKLQGSCSNPRITGNGSYPNNASAMVWDDIAGSSITYSASGHHTWNADDVNYLWVRVVWTESGSSSGSVTGTFYGKGPT